MLRVLKLLHVSAIALLIWEQQKCIKDKSLGSALHYL